MKHYKGNSTIHFYLFTDTDPQPYAPNLTNISYFHTLHANWQDGTNSKFSNILQLQNEDCDYIYYFDADTNVTKDFTESWFLGDLVGGEHWSNSEKNTDGSLKEKQFDRNPASRAYIPTDTTLPQMYYYGAFFGGKKDFLLEFCKTNYENQLADRAIKYEPCWNDESYINHYFHFTPPTFVVPSAKFAFTISDKGQIGETRIPTLNIEKYKKQILQHPEAVFEFYNRGVRFENVAVLSQINTTNIEILDLPLLIIGNNSLRLENTLKAFSTKRVFLNRDAFRNTLTNYLKKPFIFTPFIVLHDIVALEHTLPTRIECPNNADCIYLGMSRLSANINYTNWQDGVESENIQNSHSIVKINNMLSSHAYIVYSLKWVQNIIECLNMEDKHGKTLDLYIASKMPVCNVYALRYPLFYQDRTVGGSEDYTRVTFDNVQKLCMYTYADIVTRYFLSLHTVFILNQNIKWLEEYIIYYKNLGVEQFYLYDNEATVGVDFTNDPTNRRQYISKINTAEDLQSLQEIMDKYPNTITIVKWQPKDICGNIQYEQGEAVRHYMKNFGKDSKWVILMDLDEFLFSPNGTDIKNYLKHVDHSISGLELLYKPFVERTDVSGKYITQDYRCVNKILPLGTGSKNIIKCNDFIDIENIHYIKVCGSKLTMDPGIFRFNHYNLYDDCLRKPWIVKLLNLTEPFMLPDIDDGMKRYSYLFK